MRLEDRVRLAVRQLDNLLDINQSPIPETRNSDANNRAVGFGIMGFTDTIQQKGIAYDSEAAFQLIDRIMEFVSYVSIDASAELATERGSYPNYGGSRWSKGFVPYDTIDTLEKNRGVKVAMNRDFYLDWEALRVKVKKGMRNATLMAIAPTANIGLVAGTTPGVDPQFSNIFARATNRGKFLEINVNLVNDLKKANLWGKVKDDIITHQGEISDIAAIPQSEKDIYKPSFQLDPKAFIEVASRAQKWVDQAISRNMYLATRDISETMNIYTHGWSKGLKTFYYLHMKQRHTAEQSTSRVNKSEVISGGRSFGFGKFKSVTAALQPAVAVGFEMPVAEPAPVATSSVAARMAEVMRQIPAFSSIAASATSQTAATIAENQFGFGLAVAKEAESVPAQKKIDAADALNACPVDPMERLKCDSCQ